MRKLLTKVLTDGQRSFLVRKNIKVGNMYQFPMFGFHVYPSASYEHGEKLDTNPFTKSLASQFFVVKEITGDFVRGNFHERPKNPDFYLTVSELQSRSLFEMFVMFLVLVIPFSLYNLFVKIFKIKK